MHEQVTNIQKIQKLPWWYTHNLFNTMFVMVLFGSLFNLFLDALNLDKTQIGSLNSLMPFAGILALFVASWTERFGVKKAMTLFWFLRKGFASFLLLTPFVVQWYGSEAAFFWVGLTILGFAVCRAIAETAVFIWMKEIVPDSIRGRVNAVASLITATAAILMLGLSSYVLDHYEHTGLSRFIFLIGVAVVSGFISAFCLFFIPGGKPVARTQSQAPHFQAMKDALKDQTFRLFVFGTCLLTLAISSLSFTALYLKESIGFRPGLIVRFDIVATMGGLATSLLWGWAADRFGSKPIVVISIGGLVMLPVLWFLMPRNSEFAVTMAYMISVFCGVIIYGWAIAGQRYLYISAISQSNKTACMSVYYAALGLAGGISPLTMGWLIDSCKNLSYDWAWLHIDKYTPFFAVEVLLILGSLLVFNRLRADDSISIRSFLGMFVQGNPLMAISSVVRHRFAKDENQRIYSTQTMGQAKSQLSIKELLEAIEDPSFNVRYEAIIAIARSRANPRVIDALLNILDSDQPELSPAAAWALGKLHDESAILPLRETLHSNYPLLRARSARSLATLGDSASAEFFLQQLRSDASNEVQLAYVSALGTLRFGKAVPQLLTFLQEKKLNDSARSEVALALARIIGRESRYIKLWRSLREDFGTSTAQVILAVKKDLGAMIKSDRQLLSELDSCANTFAQDNIKLGTKQLATLIDKLPKDDLRPEVLQILMQCQKQLNSGKEPYKEYLILALHAYQTYLYKTIRRK